jgi:hypothetical protein
MMHDTFVVFSGIHRNTNSSMYLTFTHIKNVQCTNLVRNVIMGHVQHSLHTTFVIPISLQFTHCSTFVVLISYNLVHRNHCNNFSLMSLKATNVKTIHYKSSSCIQSCIKSNNIHTIINKFTILLCQQWFIHSKF